MLNEKVIDKVVERLVYRIEEINTYTLEQIGKSIKRIGTLSPSKAQELGQILKYGGDYDKIARKLSQITQLNIQDIYTIFDEVAKNDYRFAKQFYDYRGMKYIPYEQNIALQNQVNALTRLMIGDYVARTGVVGFSVRDLNGNLIFKDLNTTYRDVIDKAVLSVSQGKSTFQGEMYKIINELGSGGLKTVNYANGRAMRLDSAVRMDLKRNLRDLHFELQKQFGEEFGADGYEVSVHINPAPDHAEAQGRQFSKKEYDNLQNNGVAKDYKGRTIDLWKGNFFRPIREYNCYHYEFPIILGVSKPEYSAEQLQQIIDDNNKGFELDGKHYTNYEGTQLQRSLERKIREQKDIQIMAKAGDITDLVEKSQNNVTKLTKKYKELSNVSGLPTKMQRMRVSGYKRVATKK